MTTRHTKERRQDNDYVPRNTRAKNELSTKKKRGGEKKKVSWPFRCIRKRGNLLCGDFATGAGVVLDEQPPQSLSGGKK